LYQYLVKNHFGKILQDYLIKLEISNLVAWLNLRLLFKIITYQDTSNYRLKTTQLYHIL